jgi:hypothetical protein
MIRKILCKLGIHKKERVVIMGCNYSVCKHCYAGHPMVTGEW